MRVNSLPDPGSSTPGDQASFVPPSGLDLGAGPDRPLHGDALNNDPPRRSDRGNSVVRRGVLVRRGAHAGRKAAAPDLPPRP